MASIVVNKCCMKKKYKCQTTAIYVKKSMANKKQQKAAPVPFAFYLLHLRWQQFVIINQRPLLLLLMVYGQIWLWEIPIVRFSVTVPLFKWRKRINVVTLLCFTLFLFYFSWKTWFMNFGASKPNHKPWKFILKIMFSNLFKLLFWNVILGLVLFMKQKRQYFRSVFFFAVSR